MPAPATAMSPGVRDAERAKLAREIITPEGIPVKFTLAPAGERIAGFLFDVLILGLVLFLLGLLLSLAVGGADRASWLTAVIVILSFLLFNFYFAFFEVRWQGQTPGKRMIGIRVIDARGGQLEASAVLARNLVRELEVWTPLRLLFAGRALWPDAPGWALVLATGWTFVFALLPLFNKDKLRVGDLIGGTRVVMQPKPMLLPDLVQEAATSMQMKAVAGASPAAAHSFTDAQLGVYGIYELQVLEGVLRQDPASPGYLVSVATVAEKIRAKIDYRGAYADDFRFLRDFYTALRAHLEQKMLFGKRREDKFSK